MGYKKIDYKAQKGITLIEFMITSVVILIVLSLGYLIYFFGMKNLELINLRAEIQQNARLIDSLIRIELRNALKVSSENFVPDGEEEIKELDLRDGKFYYGDSQSVDAKGVSEIIFSIENEHIEEYGNQSSLLTYEIITENKVYNIKNVVFLNNTSVSDINVSLADGDKKLYYSKAKVSQ